jgi:hypothetical protein
MPGEHILSSLLLEVDPDGRLSRRMFPFRRSGQDRIDEMGDPVFPEPEIRHVIGRKPDRLRDPLRR